MIGSSFFADVDVFSAARTVVTILFTSDVNFFLLVVLAAGTGTRRKAGFEGGMFPFPSDALLSLWKVDLTLDVSLGGGLYGVASIRRRKDAEGNRNSGVKVQVADLNLRENVFSNAFRRAERKTRRGLLLLG